MNAKSRVCGLKNCGVESELDVWLEGMGVMDGVEYLMDKYYRWIIAAL